MLPDMEKGDTHKRVNTNPEQHFTQPQSLLFEATLIKTRRKWELGRLSTLRTDH